jgi:hypothetical protein
VLLADYRYVGQKSDKSSTSKLQSVSLVIGRAEERAATRGIAQGIATSDAANLARELANMPPNVLTARAIAARAVELAGERGLAAEVFDEEQLAAMGCGGMLGVNAGSVEPPRMVKLTYTPRNPKAHVALVGKGVMYDSGGLSLKPTNPMSVIMKMDMSGAAAVLATMGALKALGCRNKVTAFLMCTDNMPSGSAMKLFITELPRPRTPMHATPILLFGFAEIKAGVAPIIDMLDHHNLNDIPGLEQSTVENLAVWLWPRLREVVPGLVKITVWETATSGCEYSGV